MQSSPVRQQSTCRNAVGPLKAWNACDYFQLRDVTTEECLCSQSHKQIQKFAKNYSVHNDAAVDEVDIAFANVRATQGNEEGY